MEKDSLKGIRCKLTKLSSKLQPGSNQNPVISTHQSVRCKSWNQSSKDADLKPHE